MPQLGPPPSGAPSDRVGPADKYTHGPPGSSKGAMSLLNVAQDSLSTEISLGSS